MTDRSPNRFRPQLQPLEGRDQPGTLLVAPPGFINPNVGLAVPDDAKPGLSAAETHTHGVIVWVPGGTDANDAAVRVPFQGTADAVVTAAQPKADGLHLTLTEVGQGTQLGAFTRAETLVVHAADTISGSGVFTAANGDQVFTTVSGGFTSPTTVAGTYTITGGTGRFADASGSASWSGVTSDGIHVAVTFAGTLSH